MDNVKMFSRLYSVIHTKIHPKLFQKPESMKSLIFSVKTPPPVLKQAKLYSDKGKDLKKTGKSEELEVKMPGFIHPETIKEEGYFTQKAKQELEELKRKGIKNPTLTNPEKKE